MAVPVIAQRTRRIRIGTAVALLPLHHPLACAEQAATADLLSGGRLEFGVGRGSIPSQFHGFRVPVAENRARFDECLEIIRLTIFSQVPESYGEHLPRLRSIDETVANLPFERFWRDQAVFGDAAPVLERLLAVRDAFELSQIICWFDQGSMLPRDEVERSMRRFAEQVMPKLG